MIWKRVLAMFGLSGTRSDSAVAAVEQQLDDMLRLRRLARTEFIENLYTGVTNGITQKDQKNEHRA